jgi:putative ubiquitin-RnfH superfamily antitoxin RatB of RatAB toxin-antitoxin module
VSRAVSGEGAVKHCLVVYATPERQYLWPVALPADASVQDALVAARTIAELGPGGAPGGQKPHEARRLEVPWNEASIGIFGQVCERSAIPREGDRIEIYRPLRHDPRQARRERARRRT